MVQYQNVRITVPPQKADHGYGTARASPAPCCPAVALWGREIRAIPGIAPYSARSRACGAKARATRCAARTAHLWVSELLELEIGLGRPTRFFWLFF